MEKIKEIQKVMGYSITRLKEVEELNEMFLRNISLLKVKIGNGKWNEETFNKFLDAERGILSKEETILQEVKEALEGIRKYPGWEVFSVRMAETITPIRVKTSNSKTLLIELESIGLSEIRLMNLLKGV